MQPAGWMRLCGRAVVVVVVDGLFATPLLLFARTYSILDPSFARPVIIFYELAPDLAMKDHALSSCNERVLVPAAILTLLYC